MRSAGKFKPTRSTKRKNDTTVVARRRASQAEARRAQTRAGQDIGDLPTVKNPKRRAAALADYPTFLRTYFPRIFYLPPSKDLKRLEAKIQQVIVDRDKCAMAMPRGSGKSSECRCAVLWGVLKGLHQYGIYVGATGPDGVKALEWFKAELSENQLLLEDFPEICFPIRCLENEARRCVGQRYKGQKTNIHWGADYIVLPTIHGSIYSGCVLDATSLEGQIRGRWVRLPGGKIVRPSIAVCDDPQTRESSRSQGPNGQTTYRLRIINEDVQGLAGPDAQTAVLVPCTVIERGDLADQLLDRKLYPDYRGERTKRLYSWPTNKVLWEQYRELRESALRMDQPLDESIEFYRARRCSTGRRMDDATQECVACPHRDTCMDCGAQVDWAERLDDPRNLSAVQAAMHAFYKYGAAGFAAEFQNEPLSSEQAGKRWSVSLIMSRHTGRPRLEVPLDATEITVGVDVQQWSLWYCVAAWTPNFTGHIIDYGIWPKQKLRDVTKSDIEHSHENLQTLYPNYGIEGSIQAGLEALVTWMLARDFQRAGGAGLMRVTRMLVDSGKWPDRIAAAKMKCGGSTMVLSKGVGIKAGTTPMQARKPKKGEGKRDPLGHWYMPTVIGTKDFPHVLVDTNHWKTFCERGILTAPGDPGAITLYGDRPDEHALFAAHLDAETWVETEGHGRKVHEWNLKPNRPDNEWLDALVLSAVAASYQGCALSDSRPPTGGVIRKKRVNIDELLARRQTAG